MNEEKLKKQLQESMLSMQGDDLPEFDAVWSSANAKHRESRSRYQRLAGFAAAAAIAVTAFMMWPLNGNNVTTSYLTEDDLMSSTQWLAPSDVLLPEHQYDIYTEMPVLTETNDLEEGSRL